jgi:hypothetical protein
VSASHPTVVIVPGLRDETPGHWQSLLAQRLAKVRSVPPLGKGQLDCAARVDLLERELAAIDGPVILVAHSAGCITVAHWAQGRRRPIQGALLAAPADLETALPEGYPTLEALDRHGWLPVPRAPLPFASLVAASSNDPLARIERVAALARAWGSCRVDLGPVGHLNPASGFGPWPQAEALIERLLNPDPTRSGRAPRAWLRTGPHPHA